VTDTPEPPPCLAKHVVQYEEVAVALRSRSDAECGHGASEAAIRAAESSLGTFPVDYRAFLRDFGWTSFGSTEIAGLGEDVPWPHMDVVRVTLDERERGGLPSNLITFYSDGGGNLECVETGAGAVPDGVVFCFFHENRRLYRDAESFSDFLARELADESP